MYPARVDEKGRLKLPAGFKTYFESLAEKKLFVTSLDKRVGQIYPAAVWRVNQKFFESYRANPKAAKNVAFNANDLGGDSEMDKEGRILLPPEMRRQLGIENQAVKIFAHKGRIEIYSEAVYQERRRAATASAERDVEELEGAGLL
ncbi:MAG: division/cell wall cluster transcriptional repressor MraZ [Bryobacteraceae bacterium]